MIRLENLRRHVLLVVLTIATVQCSGTPESRYYLLTSESQPSVETAVQQSGTPSTSIFVDKAKVATYFDRSQMVTRSGESRVTYLEFDVWAEPIGGLITRSLIDHLSRRFASDRVVETPFQRKFDADYRVSVEVLRFDSNEEGNVALDAQWTLLASSEECFVGTGREVISRRIPDPTSVDQRVIALNANVAALSEIIADKILALGGAGCLQ